MTSATSIFIPSPEPGVRLQVIVARPKSKGPFPTLVFHHGSTRGGRNPKVFSRSAHPAPVLNYFAERGWLVLFPQRRGRGKSGGIYAEGLASDGTGYSCDPATTVRGFERALEDLNAVLAHVASRDDVDQNRIVTGGVSRGGILSIAHAGMRPNRFRGVINFSGGWLGQGCPTFEKINPVLFGRGAPAEVPTIWVYGKKDNYYRIDHCRSNFDGFISAGGRGEFHALAAGHALIYKQELWKHLLDGYLARIDQAPIKLSACHLRPATASDHAFALHVTEACMKSYAQQTWGSWNGEADFDPEFDEIIQLEGQDIGILGVEKHANYWQVEKLYILPAFQNQGHGSFLLEQLKAEAIVADMPIRLNVLQVNPALRFYVRHGFGVVGIAPPRIQMEWNTPNK